MRIPGFIAGLLLTYAAAGPAEAASPVSPVPGPGQPLRAAQITGRVTDAESGQQLNAVQVYVVGTSYSALTDENGRYLIMNVPAGTYAVAARLIGYADARRENVRVPAEGTVQLDITMRVTALPLDAVVVTGVIEATSARRVPFTVARVGAADLQVPEQNAVNSIQGKVAGVSVVSSPQPGSGTNILLRTPTSIYKSTAPLFVVDGVILASTFGNSTADLDALDVESVEIIKGAAAASLYGSRAANGVVQIRTRRGSSLTEGQTRLQVRSELGFNQLARRIDMSSHHNYLVNSAGQYVDANGDVVDRANRVERPESERFLDVPFPGPVYDHIDQLFNPGAFMQTSVSISQNLGATNFMASFANNRMDGVVLDAGGYEKNDFRFNLDHRLRNDLSVALSGYHMRSDRDLLPSGDVSGTFFQLVQQSPDLNLLEPDPDGTPYVFQPDPIEPSPLYYLYWRDDTEERARTLGNMNLRYTPISWFSVDGDFSYDRSDRTQRYYWPRGKKTETQSETQGYVQRGEGLTTAMNGSVSANLLTSIGDLTTRITGRALAEREEYEFFEAETANLAVEGVPDLDAGTAPVINGSYQNIKSEGYFLTTDLDYQGKYIANGLVRRDGSSLFGPDQRWHTYYRASFAYRMAEEPWWPVDWMTEFKLRYSRGTAGGRPSFSDQYETYSFDAGGTVVKRTLGNRALKPEHATEQEIGIDAVVLDRVSLQLNYARQTTEDQLIQIPLPAPFGFATQWQNAGTVEGNTWEGTVQAQLIATDETRLSVGLVADRSRHKITEFDRACFRTGTDNLSYRCAGETLGVMYGNSFAHSAADLPAGASADEFQVNDEGLLVWVGSGGSWRDGNWGQSTVIDGRTYKFGIPFVVLDSLGNSVVGRIGDGNPDFHLGFNTNLQWRNLSFYGLVDIQFGGDVYNRTNQRMYQYFRSADADQAGRSVELKKTTDYYLALYGANLINDRFVEDASYLKLRELAVRYTLPRSALNFLHAGGVDRVQLGLVGRNLFVSTKYKGYDPEVGNPLERMDDFQYPQYRTITASIQIDF